MSHVRQVQAFSRRGMCATGARAWCARHHIDLRAFLKDGMPIEQVDAIDDAFARAVAAQARVEASRG